MPATFTNLIGPADELVGYEFQRMITRDRVESRGAKLEIEWFGNLKYHPPSTWTQEEARAEFAAMLSSVARARCMSIIIGLPDDVVSIVAPQLEEIAEYETKLAVIRHEVTDPVAKERWISLPAGR